MGAVRAPPVTAVCCRTQDRAGLRPLSCCSRTRPAGPGSSRAPRTARAPLRSAPSFRAPATRGAPACGSSAPSCQRPGRRTERSPRCEQRERRPRPPTPLSPSQLPTSATARHAPSLAPPRRARPALLLTRPGRRQPGRSGWRCRSAAGDGRDSGGFSAGSRRCGVAPLVPRGVGLTPAPHRAAEGWLAQAGARGGRWESQSRAAAPDWQRARGRGGRAVPGE